MNISAKLDQIAQAMLNSREALQSSYDIATLAIRNGIPGDFVECGVYAGAQCAAMALAIMQAEDFDPYHLARSPRRVHLFDSFEGVPAAGEHDNDFRVHPAGVSACSMESVGRHMRTWGIPHELLAYHPGWFADTIPPVAGAFRAVKGSIAVLRLDGDLYDSTRVCLEHLYPLVSPGGWCIVDDFHLDGCRKATAEYFGGQFPAIYFQGKR